MAINKGLTYSETITVTPEMSAIKVGSGLVDVFATPSMIALIEKTCSDAIKNCLQPNEVTVGIEINTKHVAASKIGASIKCDVSVVDVIKNRVFFNTTVTDNGKVVGTATHVRCIVDKQRFINTLNK